MTDVTEEELRALYDYEGENRLVRDALSVAVSSLPNLLAFLGRYASWNGEFGSSVAILAGKIGRSRAMFLDPAEPVLALADRSVFVGSFFFDAARDEFDDRDTAHRDTHRCLAQAMIGGILGYARERHPTLRDPAVVNALLADPLWLTALRDRVGLGYGAGSKDDLANVFRAIGYHLGSEVLADQEFSVLDESMREREPELVAHLEKTAVRIGDEEHGAYQWLRIHSGHGGGAEADHFEWAVQGARLAFRFARPELHEALRHQLHLGFLDFSRDHREFFHNVNTAHGGPRHEG